MHSGALRGDCLDYTEKEKKGIDKVEHMNRFFDKVLMPAIGILVIMLLLSFTVNKFREKFGRDDSQPAVSTVRQKTEPEVFAKRKALLSGYSEHVKEFAAYGYKPVEGYSYDLSLCKAVDREMVIFQFSDSTLGDLTIINYIPSGKDDSYDTLSLTVSSHKLLNVSVKCGEETHTVTFTSEDFSAYRQEDGEEFDALMRFVSLDDIKTMYEIFETDIQNLAETCGAE